MSLFWILLAQGARMMEVAVTAGTIRRAKLQSNCHHQQINTQLFTGRTPFLLLDSVKAPNGKVSHSTDLLTPRSAGVFQSCI